MTLKVDVDGVLRNLAHRVFGRPACTWKNLDCEGNTLIQAVNKNPRLCLDAQPTQYLAVILNHHKHRRMHILTSQPETWRGYTEHWLDIYVGDYDVIYTNDSDEKLQYLEPGDFLIDDSPCFKRFDQIIMPDYPYNRKVDPLYRVYNPGELAYVLRRFNL